MTRNPTVCLAGTLDTKGVEYKYVKECIENQGVDVLMVDCGVIGEPYFTPDVPSSEVAAAAGVDLAEFAERKEGAEGRTKAVLSMGRGLGVVLQKLYDEGRIDAVFGMGGTGGTDLLSPAFRELPIGFPKMIVSTMGSGNTKPYVGPSDLIMANAVTDIAGLNRISLLVLGNAAHAIAGMAKGYTLRPEPGRSAASRSSRSRCGASPRPVSCASVSSWSGTASRSSSSTRWARARAWRPSSTAG